MLCGSMVTLIKLNMRWTLAKIFHLKKFLERGTLASAHLSKLIKTFDANYVLLTRITNGFNFVSVE